MTKLRAPLTFENALTRVAGVIGWSKVAEICGVAERTCRNWSDPDTTAEIRLDAALALDLTWRAKMGEGAPFLACYQARLDSDSREAFADREELIASAARVARDGGAAASSTIAAARVDAGAADSIVAERDLERAIEADTDTLAALRARRDGIASGKHEEGDVEFVRAPEAAPANTS